MAVVLLVGAGAFFYIQSKKTATTSARVGDCIQVKSASVTSADTAQIACSDPAALYVVTETSSGTVTCDESETKYTETRGSDSSSPDNTVCLRPNVKAGDCFDEGGIGATPVKGSCATLPKTSTEFKVVSIDLTTSDESKCAKDTQAISYPKRTVLICIARP